MLALENNRRCLQLSVYTCRKVYKKSLPNSFYISLDQENVIIKPIWKSEQTRPEFTIAGCVLILITSYIYTQRDYAMLTCALCIVCREPSQWGAYAGTAGLHPEVTAFQSGQGGWWVNTERFFSVLFCQIWGWNLAPFSISLGIFFLQWQP